MIILILISVVLCVIPGILVLTKVEKGGLGASLNAVFKCNSCTLQTVNFQRLALVDGDDHCFDISVKQTKNEVLFNTG